MDYSSPPVINQPPPPGSPFQQRPPSGGSGKWWLLGAVVLVVIGGLFLMGLIALASFSNTPASGVRHARHGLMEVVVDGDEGDDKIAIVDVDGIITSQLATRGGMTLEELIKEQLKAASEDKAVKAVILKVDSPGGEVLASDEIANTIRQFQASHSKPVVASMGGMAASGGYYVSAPCRWIVANELTITGSIGVIMQSYNYRGLMDKVGVQPRTFKSGKHKDMLSGSKRPDEEDPAEREMVQNMITETYNKFKSVIREGRAASNKASNGKGRKLAADWEDSADGRILTGRQALDLGLVDELGNFDTAVATASRLGGIKGQPTLVRFQEPFNFGRFFSMFSESHAKGLKIDLGVELPNLRAGRPYFLCPSVVN